MYRASASKANASRDGSDPILDDDQDYYQMWVRTKRKTMSNGNGQKDDGNLYVHSHKRKVGLM